MIPQEEARQLYLDDLVHSVGQTFLSLPMRCCKCHDHKFDPIPTKDYYRMYAAFAATQPAEMPAAFLPGENRQGFAAKRKLVEELLAYAREQRDVVLDKQEKAAKAWYSEHGLEYKNPQQFFVHSQWLVLCEEDAAFCVQNVAMLRTMAADYDLLFGIAPDAPPQITPYSEKKVLAADEIVFGTFLMIHGIRPSTQKVMAESGAGDHAAVHDTVLALRRADPYSENALFGRKIQAHLDLAHVVTWEA